MKHWTLRQLRLFEAVALHLSYSRAAQQMSLTQPAVSMQVQQLETELGLQLLVKTGKRIRLSQAGGRGEEAMAAYDQTEGGSGGLLHLGVVPTAHYFAPALLMAFARQWPGVKFKLTVD